MLFCLKVGCLAFDEQLFLAKNTFGPPVASDTFCLPVAKKNFGQSKDKINTFWLNLAYDFQAEHVQDCLFILFLN
jgi:hypothetical protein